MLDSVINITPKEAFAGLSLAVDKEFARLLSTELKLDYIAKKSIPYAAEIMKAFVCEYIDQKAQMQIYVVNKMIEKSKAMGSTYQSK